MTLCVKAGGKGFGFLAMEPTSALALPLLVFSFMGVQIHDCMAPIGQPIKALDQ